MTKKKISISSHIILPTNQYQYSHQFHGSCPQDTVAPVVVFRISVAQSEDHKLSGSCSPECHAMLILSSAILTPSPDFSPLSK